MTLKTGTQLGPYEILSPPGAEDMGEVFTTITYRSGLVGLGYLEAFSQPQLRSGC